MTCEIVPFGEAAARVRLARLRREPTEVLTKLTLTVFEAQLTVWRVCWWWL